MVLARLEIDAITLLEVIESWALQIFHHLHLLVHHGLLPMRHVHEIAIFGGQRSSDEQFCAINNNQNPCTCALINVGRGDSPTSVHQYILLLTKYCVRQNVEVSWKQPWNEHPGPHVSNLSANLIGLCCKAI